MFALNNRPRLILICLQPRRNCKSKPHCLYNLTGNRNRMIAHEPNICDAEGHVVKEHCCYDNMSCKHQVALWTLLSNLRNVPDWNKLPRLESWLRGRRSYLHCQRNNGPSSFHSSSSVREERARLGEFIIPSCKNDVFQSKLMRIHSNSIAR